MAWWFVDPGFEPVITGVAAVAGLISAGLVSTVREGRGEADDASEAGPRVPESDTADRRRIAVLPLANIHPDRDQDYFADGMTEELISVISRIQGLDVIARTSIMTYRDTTKPVSDIGRELSVGSVLEGSVRKAGDKLRVTVQLIDVPTQGHLWSQDYDREMREIFEVQSDVARSVADALKVTLLGDEARRIELAPTQNLEAYDLYLLGRHHLNKRTDSGIRKAIELFEKAVELDPGFAPAHAGLADAYVLAGIGYAAIPEALPRAKEAALQALDLDGELPQAHTSLGYIELNHERDWRTAESELTRAIELDPSDARAHQWYAHVASYRHRFVEAAERFERARKLDPLSVVIQNESGWPSQALADFDEALSRFRKAASMEPSFAMAHFNMGNCHEGEGYLEDAIACYRRAVDLSGRTALMVSFLAAALARSGRPDEARPLLEELRAQAGGGAHLSAWLAVAYEALGDKASALDHLEQAVERREPILVCLDTPFLAFPSLQGDPRYQEVRRRVSTHWAWDAEMSEAAR